MGVETAIALGALSVATSAAGAVNQASAAGQARKLQGQAAAEQTLAADATKQQNEIEKQLAETELRLARAAAADGVQAASLSRTATALLGSDLATTAAVQRNNASRLVAEAAAIGASVDMAMQDLALRDATVRRTVVENTAEAAAKAVRGLATARVLAAEAGLSGTTMQALMRETAVTSGAEGARALAAGREALDGLQIERNKVRLSALSALVDLGAKTDAATAAAAKGSTDAARLVLQSQQDDMNMRSALANKEKVELQGIRAAAGLATRDVQINSEIKRIGISDQIAGVTAAAATTNGILGVIGSGLQIASGINNARMISDARATANATAEARARTGNP